VPFQWYTLRGAFLSDAPEKTFVTSLFEYQVGDPADPHYYIRPGTIYRAEGYYQFGFSNLYSTLPAACSSVTGLTVLNHYEPASEEHESMLPDPLAFSSGSWFATVPLVTLASGGLDPPFRSDARRKISAGDWVVGVLSYDIHLDSRDSLRLVATAVIVRLLVRY